MRKRKKLNKLIVRPWGRLRRILELVLTLFLVSLVIIFMLENEQPVRVSIFGWSSSELPVAVHIVAALLAGMVIGLVVGFVAIRKRKFN